MDHLNAARTMADACLCFRARRTARAITRLYDAALRPTGLQATQVTLMNAVALGPRGAQPMGRLADILALEISTLTRNLRPLQHAGLLEIRRDPKDRRVRLVCLTETGKARLVAALPHWNRAHAAIVATIGGATATSLHEALDATSRALSDPPTTPDKATACPLSATPGNPSSLGVDR
ncbi:MAG: winged helix-turn-helix transcriptional regulator [Pararhodobacter sp.]|nr:winged helix-turn-helix transcriptional regulator [Pararhodobacter sp.]